MGASMSKTSVDIFWSPQMLTQYASMENLLVDINYMCEELDDFLIAILLKKRTAKVISEIAGT